MRSGLEDQGRKSGPTQRQLRIGEQIRHILSEIMMERASGNSIVDSSSITVGEVRISPDLRSATVYVMPLGGGDAPGIVKELNNSKGYFSKELARQMTTKVTPKLLFKEDHLFNNSSKIERLLNDPRVREDLAKPNDD